MKRFITVLLICVLFVSGLIACNEKENDNISTESGSNVDNTKPENGNDTSDYNTKLENYDNTNTDSTKNEKNNDNEEVAIVGKSKDPKPKDNNNESDEKHSNKWTATLYLSDENHMYVVPEDREFTSDKELDTCEKAEIILNELIKESKNYKTSIPAETKVLSVKQDGNNLIINLSKEFNDNHVGGSTGIEMTMAPIVLSLTELDGVVQVSFKIGGKTIEDFQGMIVLNRPYGRKDYENSIAN